VPEVNVPRLAGNAALAGYPQAINLHEPRL